MKGKVSFYIAEAIPSGCHITGQNFVLEQENESKNNSKLCTNYLKSKEDQGILHIMIWLPQFPGLSQTGMKLIVKFERNSQRISKSCLPIYILLGNHFHFHTFTSYLKGSKEFALL